MPEKVAYRLAASIEEQASTDPVEVVWHGGEPLTTPVAHMRKILAAFEDLRQRGRVVHGVQTNATLINPEWIELFRRFGFRVGVSLDGPRQGNSLRLNWAGRDSHNSAMRGIHRLRRAGIPFMVICVVTAETIEHADELVDFFAGLDCDTVGFNIEEQEGLNAGRRQVTSSQAEAFWRRLWELQNAYPNLRIRDLERFRSYLRAARGGLVLDSEPVAYDPIPTVGTTGQTVVLSPELLGIDAPNYGDFVIGNVLVSSLPKLLSSLGSVPYVAEFDRGLRFCAASCQFWDYCRGAQAGNRYFENGCFDSTETAYCRNTYQAIVRTALDRIEERGTT